MFQNIKFGYTLIKRIKIFIKYKMPTHSLYLTTDIPTTTPAITRSACQLAKDNKLNTDLMCT